MLKRVEEFLTSKRGNDLKRSIWVYAREASFSRPLCDLLGREGYKAEAVHDLETLLAGVQGKNAPDLMVFSVQADGWEESLADARRVAEVADVFPLFHSDQIDGESFKHLRTIPHLGCVRGGEGSEYHFLFAVEAGLRRNALVREKDLLYRELRHRVKNNMLVIHSLLSLEAAGLSDPAALAGYSRIQDRIRAMIRLYDEIYSGGESGAVAFHEYLRDLALSLFEAYVVDSEKVRVEFRFEEIFGSMKQAVPLGLIMNELVSNVLKHAFPASRRGTVSINFFKSGREARLVVKDDGVGLPSNFDPAASLSLGMRLVDLMAVQLSGRFDFSGAPGRGSEFRVVFPL